MSHHVTSRQPVFLSVSMSLGAAFVDYAYCFRRSCTARRRMGLYVPCSLHPRASSRRDLRRHRLSPFRATPTPPRNRHLHSLHCRAGPTPGAPRVVALSPRPEGYPSNETKKKIHYAHARRTTENMGRGEIQRSIENTSTLQALRERRGQNCLLNSD